MRVLLFLNELSCASDADERAVDGAMREFVNVVRQVRKKRTDTALVTPSPLPELELAPGYYLQQWIGKPGNRDRWRYIQSARSMSPFSSVLAEDVTKSVSYAYRGQTAEGLGGAHLMDGLAVSLPVDSQWQKPWIRVDRTRLSPGGDDDQELEEDGVDVRHAWCCDEVGCHEEWITYSGLSGIVSGAELWEARADFFPHLRFLPRVERNLRELETAWLRPVRNRLLELEAAISEWHPARSPEPRWRSHITPDSENRTELCDFTDLDGEVRNFGMHARFTPGPGRLHFRLVPGDRVATVAHVGRKLGE